MTIRRPSASRALLAGLTLAVLTGCSVRQPLDVRYPEAGVNRALLATVPPQRVTIGPVVDRRLDTSRIGIQPKDGGDILTSRPVSEIVRDALTAEVRRNGHALVAGTSDVVLVAEVEEFWLDVVVGHPGVMYVGKVVLAVAVVDGQTGETLFTRRYAGTRRQAADPDAAGVAREVMDTALARTLHDLATDPSLVAAVGRRPPA
jgi:hypothetical protein